MNMTNVVPMVGIEVAHLLEARDILENYQAFLNDLVEETEWDELNKQAMIFRIDCLLDVIEKKFARFKDE